MEKCKNCSAEVIENYCQNCGHPTKLKRIDGHYIIHEIEHVLHFERGILYTIKGLLKSPGKTVRDYISENRSRLVKPIIFIIITSLVYTLLNHFFHFEDGYVNYTETQTTTTSSIFKWIQSHYGYANIIMSVFIAFWTKLLFRKSQFNIFEILILLCFVMGMGMLIFSVFAIVQGLIHIDMMQLAGVVGFIYMIWAIGQFFDKQKVMTYIKALVAYLLGMLTFTILAIALGGIIDLIIKH